jgi:hypothetical protein
MTGYRGEKTEWYSANAKKIGSIADFSTMLSKPIISNQGRRKQMCGSDHMGNPNLCIKISHFSLLTPK